MTIHGRDLKSLPAPITHSDDELLAAAVGSFIVGLGFAVMLLIALVMG